MSRIRKKNPKQALPGLGFAKKVEFDTKTTNKVKFATFGRKPCAPTIR
jgi:hypothetical protein